MIKVSEENIVLCYFDKYIELYNFKHNDILGNLELNENINYCLMESIKLNDYVLIAYSAYFSKIHFINLNSLRDFNTDDLEGVPSKIKCGRKFGFLIENEFFIDKDQIRGDLDENIRLFKVKRSIVGLNHGGQVSFYNLNNSQNILSFGIDDAVYSVRQLNTFDLIILSNNGIDILRSNSFKISREESLKGRKSFISLYDNTLRFYHIDESNNRYFMKYDLRSGVLALDHEIKEANNYLLI
jgi:hypothetical protein